MQKLNFIPLNVTTTDVHINNFALINYNRNKVVCAFSKIAFMSNRKSK